MIEVEQYPTLQAAVFQGGHRPEIGVRREVGMSDAVGPRNHRALANHGIRTDLAARTNENMIADEIGGVKGGLRMDAAGKSNADEIEVLAVSEPFQPCLLDGRRTFDEFPAIAWWWQGILPWQPIRKDRCRWSGIVVRDRNQLGLQGPKQ